MESIRFFAKLFSSLRTLLLAITLSAASCCTDNTYAGAPFVDLGPAASLAFSQPVTTVEIFDDQRSLGPSTANRFVLDTGANGILLAAEAYDEAASRGYRVEGTFREQGVAGFSETDVSAPYTFQLTDHAGNRRKLTDVRLMSNENTSFCQLSFCPFYGVAGMPTMTGRVASLDLESGDISDALGQ
ncbi:MAG: hypothetical protein KDB27_06610, partial [Planctomycetales bacterium]|nr:hypothetical protein [Planctomycetales bacterium]